jgi:hypothetical protein
MPLNGPDDASSSDQASVSLEKDGFFVFNDVFSNEELGGLRRAAEEHFKRAGRRLPGGGLKQANAAVEIPAIEWLFHHPRVLHCFREALGTDSIMFTSHADLQKDVPGGWHKDDGTSESSPDSPGYFSKFAYDADDCKVYKMAVYLESHDHDHAGLWVRDGSHRVKSYERGTPHYLGPRAGGVIIFDVRITHSGQFKSKLYRAMLKLGRFLPARVADPAFTKTRAFVRAVTNRQRIAYFFTFGVPNAYTIEFARNNILRQLSLTPGTNMRLPKNLKNELERAGVLLAEDHFNVDDLQTDGGQSNPQANKFATSGSMMM